MLKAERSLTFLVLTTSICMISLALTNVYFFIYANAFITLTARPFQIDLLLFLPIWVLYFTHPAFKPKTVSFCPLASSVITSN
ncbi:hypothetical protein OSTOST_22028, partial [Ostertagia ostertagi]